MSFKLILYGMGLYAGLFLWFRAIISLITPDPTSKQIIPQAAQAWTFFSVGVGYFLGLLVLKLAGEKFLELWPDWVPTLYITPFFILGFSFLIAACLLAKSIFDQKKRRF